MTADLEARVAELEGQVRTLTAALEAASQMQLGYHDSPRIYFRKQGELSIGGGHRVRTILAEGGMIEPPQRDG